MKWATSVSVPKRPKLRDTHANCVSLGMSAKSTITGGEPGIGLAYESIVHQ